MTRALDVTALAGRWKGTYRLWVMPGEPPNVSQTTASLSSAAGGNFTRLDYTWDYDGLPQDGSILVGFEEQRAVVVAVWVDSWHMSDKLMLCEGRATGNGGSAVEFRGSYAAPPGPDWGWRTVIDAPEGSLRMRM